MSLFICMEKHILLLLGDSMNAETACSATANSIWQNDIKIVLFVYSYIHFAMRIVVFAVAVVTTLFLLFASIFTHELPLFVFFPPEFASVLIFCERIFLLLLLLLQPLKVK